MDFAPAALNSEVLRTPADAFGLGQRLPQSSSLVWRQRGTTAQRDTLEPRRLLSSNFDGQPLAALLAPARQDLTAPEGSHTGAKPVGAAAAGIMRLVRTLHRSLLYSRITKNRAEPGIGIKVSFAR